MNDDALVTRGILKRELKQEFDNFAIQMVKLLQPRFDAIDKRLDDHDKKFDSLFGLIDKNIKDVGIYYHEALARNNQIDRHERWLVKIGKKTDVQLDY